MGKLNPPLVVEVTRGEAVECKHHVDAVIVDADGQLVEAWGDGGKRIFPRSSVKALQAIPLVESGAADAAGFKPHHLALACASHYGEPIHTKAASEMLELTGHDSTCLECGAQLPELPSDFASMIRVGEVAGPLQNNCSGKHSGFIALAGHMNWKVEGYTGRQHPVQQEVAALLSELIGTEHSAGNAAIDGCSIPTYHVPIQMLASAFARFGIAHTGDVSRGKAMIRLRDACFDHPEMVAGSGGACTTILRNLKGRAFVKIGAEGVYTASFPELGYGLALKVQDGAKRAAEVAVGNLIVRILGLDIEPGSPLNSVVSPQLKNRRDIVVGELRACL